MKTLPAGYVDLHFMAMHVANLRKHTSDIHRMQKYLPLAIELSSTEPFSPESLAVFEKADCKENLLLTCRELGELWHSEADG